MGDPGPHLLFGAIAIGFLALIVLRFWPASIFFALALLVGFKGGNIGAGWFFVACGIAYMVTELKIIDIDSITKIQFRNKWVDRGLIFFGGVCVLAFIFFWFAFMLGFLKF